MLILAALISFLPLSLATPLQAHDSARAPATCIEIADSITTASEVFYPDSPGYINDTKHWVPSSSEVSQCSVEPGTVEDVVTIVRILGETKTQFAIRCGGHATTKGFSSTRGVQINLVRLNSVTYDQVSSTVTIGTGQLWSNVYKELEPHGVNVVGGRIVGVGVTGFTLGGGYSWLSNRHGLAIDTVTAFELVLPNTTVVNVTASSAPDLFFGLKGGFNNFGLVTKITFQAYKQGLVWGGLVDYTGDNIKKVNAAVVKFFATNTNPDANCLFSIFWSKGVPLGSLFLFYNGETPPLGLFSDFLEIPHSSNDAKTRTFLEFITATSVNYLNPEHLRGTLSSVSLPNITVPVLDAAFAQGEFWGKVGRFSTDPLVSFIAEPFISKYLVRPINDAAYPHDVFVTPFNLFFAWPSESEDRGGRTAIEAASASITRAIVQDGQNLTDTVLYPNYALGDATIESLYGANVPILKDLRKKYDPTGIFLRTGGFKFV